MLIFRYLSTLNTETIGWVFLRASGIILFLYLFYHLYSAQGAGLMFNLQNSFLKLFIFAVFAVHSLNGIRVIVIDMGWFSNSYKRLFIWLSAVGLVLIVFSFFMIFK